MRSWHRRCPRSHGLCPAGKHQHEVNTCTASIDLGCVLWAMKGVKAGIGCCQCCHPVQYWVALWEVERGSAGWQGSGPKQLCVVQHCWRARLPASCCSVPEAHLGCCSGMRHQRCSCMQLCSEGVLHFSSAAA